MTIEEEKNDPRGYPENEEPLKPEKACLHPFTDVKDDGKVVCSVCKEEETGEQEELETAHWVRIINDSKFYDGSPHNMIKFIAHFKKLGFTITRKQ